MKALTAFFDAGGTASGANKTIGDFSGSAKGGRNSLEAVSAGHCPTADDWIREPICPRYRSISPDLAPATKV
jgi:hypothetical protein